jgi:MarR family transcriptional regulator, transcriptional regulator for hemolysin
MDINGHKINQLARYFNKSLNEEISAFGLFSSQWAIIMYLYRYGESTQTEIGQYLCVEAPTITRTLSRMEKMGWIKREAGREDKRAKIISLSSEAVRMYTKWEEVSENLEFKAVAEIDKKELEIFNRVLEQMMINLE